MLDDVRYSTRRLLNSPGFSAVAMATLALAIGANTAMFSFVHGLLLSPLPYPEPDRIVRVVERHPAGAPSGISTLNYLDWVNQNGVFEYLAAEAGWRATLAAGDEPVLVRGARVSPRYFDIFGVVPAIGRTFRPGDDERGKDRIVVLSHALWENRFGSNPALPGHAIVVNGEAYTVVGILPKGGPFDRAAAQIWTPLALEPSDRTRDFHWLAATARLKPGVTLDTARAGMDVIARHLGDAYPTSNKGWGVAVDRLADVVVGPELQTAIVVLFAATLLVLLIGCANLANLALACGVARDTEMAVRAALGAGRWRLIRQVLVENILIALCGGLLGVVVGFAMMKWIQWLIPPSSLPPAVEIRVNSSVFLFTFVIAVLTGLLFGIAPAWQARPAPLSALRDGGYATTSSGSRRRVRAVLVVTEVALAFVLLVASGLLMRSFINLLDVDPGFTAANVLTAALPLDQKQHPDTVELNAYLASITTAIEAVPGVRATALTSSLPLQGWGYGVPYAIAGRGQMDAVNRRPAFFKMVSPSYFDALGIRLRAGRMLSDRDRAGTPHVALINETFAEREFPGESPIGHRILAPEVVAGKTAFGPEISWEIAGVVANERITGLGDETSAGLYVSYQQSPTYGTSLVLRAEIAPESLEKAVRAAVSRVNRNQALGDVRTLEQIVQQSMVGTRVVGSLLAVFAALALVLAAFGIYGVMSYTAAQRTRELGIRAALGADPAHLCMLVFKEGMRLTVIGLGIGLVGSLPTTDVITSMLYGVESTDVFTRATVAAVLAGVAGLSCFLPGRRIAKADPVEALRTG